MASMDFNKLPGVREMLPEAFPHVDKVHSVPRNDYEYESRIFSCGLAGNGTQSHYSYEPQAPYVYSDISRRESVASVDYRYPSDLYSPSTTASYHGSRAASPIVRNLSQSSYMSQEHELSVISSSRRRKRHQSIHDRRGLEKRAQDKRHKTSEKQRRDYQGVYIDCGDKIRDIIHAHTPQPACTYCHEPDKKPKLANSKKAKKIKLEESTMFDFRKALHMSTDAVHEIMREIASLAQSLSNEKEIGLMTDPNNQWKWSEDVRGQVARELLTLMRQDCLRHGIEPLDEFESASHYSDTSVAPTGSPASSVSGRSSRL